MNWVIKDIGINCRSNCKAKGPIAIGCDAMGTQSPERALETRQREPADIFVVVQGSDTTMLNRNPAACNKKNNSTGID